MPLRPRASAPGSVHCAGDRPFAAVLRGLWRRRHGSRSRTGSGLRKQSMHLKARASNQFRKIIRNIKPRDYQSPEVSMGLPVVSWFMTPHCRARTRDSLDAGVDDRSASAWAGACFTTWEVLAVMCAVRHAEGLPTERVPHGRPRPQRLSNNRVTRHRSRTKARGEPS